jgi:hypothetical protein
MPDEQPGAQDRQTTGVSAVADTTATVLGVPPRSAVPSSTEQRPAQRNPIFAELVQVEDDLEGLVSYALYKQNKRDWLASFFKTHGRDPTDSEIQSYILGERTQRRLATYRRLAEGLIEKKAIAIVAEQARSGPVSLAAPAGPTQRPVALKEASLRSALAGSKVEPKASTSKRSSVATLLFWIAVLIAIAAVSAWYFNHGSLFLSR